MKCYEGSAGPFPEAYRFLVNPDICKLSLSHISCDVRCYPVELR